VSTSASGSFNKDDGETRDDVWELRVCMTHGNQRGEGDVFCQENAPGRVVVAQESREMLGVMPLSGSPRPQGPCLDTSA
jgi:hypothetical protein